jgi:hypothetical protein
LDEITDKGIKVGQHLKYEFVENTLTNNYSVMIDDKELNVSSEMANNIFIRV